MRMYMWTPYTGRTRPQGPLTLMQTIRVATLSSQELDDLANINVGEQYCIPEEPCYPNDPSKPQQGDFTRVE